MAYLFEFEEARRNKRLEIQLRDLRFAQFHKKLAQIMDAFEQDAALGKDAKGYARNEGRCECSVGFTLRGATIRVECGIEERGFPRVDAFLLLVLAIEGTESAERHRSSRVVSFGSDDDVDVGLVETMRLLGKGAAIVDAAQ